MTLVHAPFIYLRHGETDWNARLLAQGHSDVELNATGIAQAERAAATLEGRGIDAIVASPLKRADRTARIVAARLGLPVATEPLLHEVSFGVREGEPMGDWYEHWLHGGATPGNGESFASLVARAERALGAHLAPGRLPLLVAHGALFRAVRAVLGQPIDVRLPNGVPFGCTPADGGWRVELL